MQLAHIEQETSWQDHGFIRLKSALGDLYAECPDFQHNRPLGKSWESGGDQIALVRQAMDAHLAKLHGLWTDGPKPQVPIEPVSLRAEPDVVGQGKSSMYKMSARQVAIKAPLRRSSSFVHSRNQSRPRSPLVDNGQKVLRSKGRGNSTTRSFLRP